MSDYESGGNESEDDSPSYRKDGQTYEGDGLLEDDYDGKLHVSHFHNLPLDYTPLDSIP